MKQAIEKEWVTLCMTCIVFFVVLTIPRDVNAGVTIPNSFTPGATISSSQMNQNFTAVANQMPGVKSVETGGQIVVPTTSGTMLSITVTVPGAGYVVVTASGSIDCIFSVAGAMLVRVKVSQIASDTSETPGIQFLRFPASVGSYVFPFSTTKLFSVTSASTVTYYLNMWNQLGVGALQLDDTTLTAVFIPNALP